MASSQNLAPKPLYPKAKEPVGWDSEKVEYMETPVPVSYWFVPWNHTQYWDSETAPAGHLSKLLFYMTGELKDEHRGSGIVIEETTGDIVGCYKVYADTGEQAEQTKTDLFQLKGELSSVVDDHKAIMLIPEQNRTLEQQEKLTELQTEMEDLPKEVRRLNGLYLDPRPQYIALHEPKVFRVHRAMVGKVFKNYGDEYRCLELRIRKAMGDTFDMEQDLPLYRQQDEKKAKAAGLKLPDFSDTK